GDRDGYELQARVVRCPGFIGEVDIVEFGGGEGADEDGDAGGVQGGHFVGEPVPAAGFGHGAESSGSGLVDGEQGGAHLVAAPTFWLRSAPSGVAACPVRHAVAVGSV